MKYICYTLTQVFSSKVSYVTVLSLIQSLSFSSGPQTNFIKYKIPSIYSTSNI